MTGPIAIKTRARTSAQISAARPEASVWVSANAGTGKTGVLVDRISRLLLAGVAPEQILCLTFTKAAAAEMANRLSDLLSGWSAMPDDALMAELRALGETDIDDDMIQQARRLFALTLEAPEGLRIRTIHSFCESLLGRFPLEARISPDFRVMDERDQREMQLQARDTVLRGADAGRTELTSAIRTIAGLVDEDGFAGLMAELDGARARFRLALNRHGGPQGLINAVAEIMGVGLHETAPDALRKASDMGPEETASLERLCAAWDEGSATNKTNAAEIRAFLGMPVEQRAAVWRDMFAAQFLTQKDEPKADRTLLSKGAEAVDPDAIGIAHRAAETCLEVLDRIKAINTVQATSALIRIGTELINAYEEIKAHRGRLDYDDLIARASMLLDSPSGISWVHYKLDGGIEHVLVDEAQDTSPEQWRVVEELVSDFYTGKSRYQEIGERPRTVFAVGDEKQSIYSFQGADPIMFGTMEARFEKAVTAAKQTWLRVEMAESFRSTAAVLDVVDRVFADPANADGLRFGDGRILHRSARSGQAGRVEIWPREEPQEDDNKDTPWDTPLDHVKADSPESRVADRIAEKIRAMIGKEILPAQGRPVRAGDILILVQKRKRFAELMVNKLKSLDIPVSGRDRMVLPEQLAIQDLIALGRLTLLPDDDLNTATVLKGPLIGLSEDDLFDIAYGRGGTTVLEALRSKRNTSPAFAHAWSRIAEWRRRADFMPPFEFFSEILTAEHGNRDLIARLGPEAADPIDDFLAAALDFERDHVPSLEGFLHWLEIGSTEVKRDLEQSRDEVRVMTVHGAKGLQAEIVFLADACVVPAKQNTSRLRWFDDAGVPVWPGYAGNETEALKAIKDGARTDTMGEYRRLLYVALTRAKDRLYIAGFTGKKGPSDTSWYDMAWDAVGALGREETASDGRAMRVYETSQTAEPDGGKVDADADAATTPLPAWASVAPGDEPNPPKPLSPSRPDGAEPPVRSPLDTDDGARFRRGLAVHALMQTLPELPTGARAQACAGYLKRPVLGFDAAAQGEIGAEVMAILENPAIAELFGPNSRAEVPIAGTIETQNGPRIISGQIDRLVVTGDAVLIVDYKTNRPPPLTPDATPPVYLRQMATYRAALAGVFPGIPVRCVLLWTDGPNWMELPDQLLDGHAP